MPLSVPTFPGCRCSGTGCPAPPGTGPCAGTCLCCLLCSAPVGGCERMPRAEERLSHLLSGDLNGFTSAEHPEPPAKHPMGASHVKMVFSWTRELKEQQMEHGNLSLQGLILLPPASWRTAGFAALGPWLCPPPHGWTRPPQARAELPRRRQLQAA